VSRTAFAKVEQACMYSIRASKTDRETGSPKAKLHRHDRSAVSQLKTCGAKAKFDTNPLGASSPTALQADAKVGVNPIAKTAIRTPNFAIRSF